MKRINGVIGGHKKGTEGSKKYGENYAKELVLIPKAWQACNNEKEFILTNVEGAPIYALLRSVRTSCATKIMKPER